jgi:short-subunit dehydrogenase
MRNLDKSNGIIHKAKEESFPLQVTQVDIINDNSVRAAIEKIISEKGGIDVLVNSAGYGLFGSLEDISIEELETNFFASNTDDKGSSSCYEGIEVGHIVNISSGAGRIGYPTVSRYVSSKFALEGLSESLSYETDQFGIRTLLIEPGCVKTNFVNGIVHAKNASNSNSAYSSVLKKLQSNYYIAMQNGPLLQKRMQM